MCLTKALDASLVSIDKRWPAVLCEAQLVDGHLGGAALLVIRLAMIYAIHRVVSQQQIAVVKELGRDGQWRRSESPSP